MLAFVRGAELTPPAHTLQLATAAENGINAAHMPKYYRKVEIKYSRFGVEVGVGRMQCYGCSDVRPVCRTLTLSKSSFERSCGGSDHQSPASDTTTTLASAASKPTSPTRTPTRSCRPYTIFCPSGGTPRATSAESAIRSTACSARAASYSACSRTRRGRIAKRATFRELFRQQLRVGSSHVAATLMG